MDLVQATKFGFESATELSEQGYEVIHTKTNEVDSHQQGMMKVDPIAHWVVNQVERILECMAQSTDGAVQTDWLKCHSQVRCTSPNY